MILSHQILLAGHSFEAIAHVPNFAKAYKEFTASLSKVELGATVFQGLFDRAVQVETIKSPLSSSSPDAVRLLKHLPIWILGQFEDSDGEVERNLLRIRDSHFLESELHKFEVQPIQMVGTKNSSTGTPPLAACVTVDVAVFCSLGGDVETFLNHLFGISWRGLNPAATTTCELIVLQLQCSEAITVDLHEHLNKLLKAFRKLCNTLIIVSSASVFSAFGLSLSDDCSWEEFADRVRDRFEPNGKFGALVSTFREADQLIIRNKSFSVVRFDKSWNSWYLHYVVSPNHRATTAGGYLRGRNTLFVGGFVYKVFTELLKGSKLNYALITQGITQGLKCCCKFEIESLGKADSTVDPKQVAARYHELILNNHHEGSDFYSLKVPNSGSSLRSAGSWTIVDAYFAKGDSKVRFWNGEGKKIPYNNRISAIQFAGNVVRKGLVAELIGNPSSSGDQRPIPIVRFGKLTIVDRHAYEEVYEIQAAMRAYVDNYREERKPLCLGLFAPPGGGKSFTVKELAKSLASDVLLKEPIEVNVSQHDHPAELGWVFKKVRDHTLEKKVPLVFFDEFDADLAGKRFGWLKWFLAPMQDGKYGGGDDPIQFRTAIFVFVGGLNHTFDMFSGRVRDREFIEAKGPDFVSRLSRFLNAIAITKRSEADSAFMIRRAEVIRTMLKDFHPTLFPKGTDGECLIDEEVVRALLQVPSFRHGVRSLEAILRTSRLHPLRPFFHWASLPPKSQLDMHVDLTQLDRFRNL